MADLRGLKYKRVDYELVYSELRVDELISLLTDWKEKHNTYEELTVSFCPEGNYHGSSIEFYLNGCYRETDQERELRLANQKVAEEMKLVQEFLEFERLSKKFGSGSKP